MVGDQVDTDGGKGGVLTRTLAWHCWSWCTCTHVVCVLSLVVSDPWSTMPVWVACVLAKGFVSSLWEFARYWFGPDGRHLRLSSGSGSGSLGVVIWVLSFMWWLLHPSREWVLAGAMLVLGTSVSEFVRFSTSQIRGKGVWLFCGVVIVLLSIPSWGYVTLIGLQWCVTVWMLKSAVYAVDRTALLRLRWMCCSVMFGWGSVLTIGLIGHEFLEQWAPNIVQEHLV